jgi:hypothetical protein
LSAKFAACFLKVGVCTCYIQAKLRQKLQSIENDPQLDTNEKSKRKQSLLLLHSIGSPGTIGNPGIIGSPGTLGSPGMVESPGTVGSPGTIGSPSTLACLGLEPLGTSPSVAAAMSPHAPSFYPAGDTVESVIGMYSQTNSKISRCCVHVS